MLNRVQERMNRLNIRNVPIVTTTLIVINVLIFLIMEIGGNYMNHRFITNFAMLWPRITEKQEWYRLLTACFIHFGFEHLVSNMFMLALLGDRLEKTVGSLRFAFAYLLSGICGAGASLLFHMFRNESLVSAGASGAIYGVLGALFGYLVIRGGFVDGVGKRQLIVMIFFMIYTSTIGDSVDIAAHVGGLAAGFLLGLLFAVFGRRRRTWP